ncbi:MAG: N-acetylmuramoyl-L-alanine amidase [Planctomycetota bacterium]
MRTLLTRALLAALLPLFSTSCETTRYDVPRGEEPTSRVTRSDPFAPRVGDEIVICGRRFSTGGAPVVLWNETGGYNAYSTRNHFSYTTPKSEKRYTPGRVRKNSDESRSQLVDSRATDPMDISGVVDQFVLHYDVCGTSQTCFRVLHDERCLSVHFLLDVDGTIYQTMDVRDQAWHASQANLRSVGVEIAHIGAYPSGNAGKLDEWYDSDPLGPFVRPEKIDDRGVRTPGFLARPASKNRIVGTIHGRTYEQYDFTREQYDSLAKLAATLNRVLPGIRLDAPRDEDRRIQSTALSDGELDAFQGILGHFHVTERKQDPGPAFDWEAFLRQARDESFSN